MTEESSKEGQIGIVLLAAGASSRLGQPKQLLPYKNKTLLRYSLEQAIASNAQTVVVVLGAKADVLQKEISNHPIHVVINEHWQEGMASSIRSGINELTELNPEIEGVILAMCDQPFMTAALLNTLITVYQKTGKRIVACTYDNTFGPPVFFRHSLFPELLGLKGDLGARSIVQKHIVNVEAVDFPKGTFDIDTREDYENVKNENS